MPNYFRAHICNQTKSLEKSWVLKNLDFPLQDIPEMPERKMTDLINEVLGCPKIHYIFHQYMQLLFLCDIKYFLLCFILIT